MSQTKGVADIYKSVVNDVIEGVKHAFLDDSVDDQVLQELRQLWESKLLQSKAMEPADHDVRHAGAIALSTPTTIQIKHQAQQQSHQQLQQQQQQQQPQQQPLTAQLLSTAAAANTGSIPQQQQPINVQGQVLITPAQQLGNASQTSTITLPVPAGAFQQHLASLQYLVPGQPGQFVIQTGARFIPSQQGLPGTVLAVATPSTTATTGQSISSKTVNQQVIQLDGLHDSSSDEDDDEDEDDEEQNEDNEEPQGEEEDPLNSDDDVSDTDPTEVFDAENVVVCQFDKINRSKNKWRFHLKDGIMNLNGKDHVFQKANGDAEW